MEFWKPMVKEEKILKEGFEKIYKNQDKNRGWTLKRSTNRASISFNFNN